MNTRNDTGFKPFLVGTGGVVRNTRVKLDTGTIVTAGAGEDAIGVALDTVADGVYCAVKLFCAPGTQAIVAAGTFALGATIYGAATGQIDDAVSGNKIGTAAEACTAAGQVIEIIPAGVAELFSAQALIADPVSAVAMTAVAPAAVTSHAITDSSTGTPSTTEIAEITGSANAGSADLAPVEDAIATLAAEQALVKTDLAACRAEVVKLVTDAAAVRTGSEANNTAIDAILAALKLNGIILSA